MLESAFLLIVLAVLCEALVEWVKDISPTISEISIKLASFAVGVILAVGADANLFNIIGVQFRFEWVGWILSGIVVSRGSNYVNDLIGRIRGENLTTVCLTVEDCEE